MVSLEPQLIQTRGFGITAVGWQTKRFHKGFVSRLLVNIYFIVYFLTELDPKSGFSIDEVFH